MVLGILSLFFILMGLSFPIAALGIVTALLSRGNQMMDSRAKIGLAISLFSIAVGICVMIWSYRVMNTAEFQLLLNQYKEVYGLQ